jgi:prolyl-tRNA synthetase
MEKAEALAPAVLRCRYPADDEDAHAGQSTCEDVVLLGAVVDHRQVAVLATDIVDGRQHQGAQIWLLLVRGNHDMNETR